MNEAYKAYLKNLNVELTKITPNDPIKMEENSEGETDIIANKEESFSDERFKNILIEIAESNYL